ncbi:hypothetical protein GCM10018980_03860 [Streptomyces capoamus]|uniref:Uncharacterized protein n=1 Tax=Streptomyces capoamus TaxID=68183 RepID=A0A919C112_9ACTN|nr:hypothetical protein GCM10010501_11850 [Streptomyces libani subsp. rufus]GHG34360.1 hypothetical protein GCM10018980_03860 [Streptomyces capoamus]
MSGALADRAPADAHEAEVGLLRTAPEPDLGNKGLCNAGAAVAVVRLAGPPVGGADGAQCGEGLVQGFRTRVGEA